MEQRERFMYLFNQYADKKNTAEEKLELMEYINSGNYEEKLYELVAQRWDMNIPVIEMANEKIRTDEVFEKIVLKLNADQQQFFVDKTRRIFPWRRVVAAASVVLLIGAGTYFLFFNHAKQTQLIQTQLVQTQQQRFKNDVSPGGYKAKLTLADGKTIVLDNAKVGELVRQGKTIVINKDGQLAYQSNERTNEVVYNTLSTARGETYSTVLADGSKVWLNSASSIKFPVAFIGNERSVEITGEAYFEIKHNEKMPFKVLVNGMEVQDLGTEFNINAYNDEEVIKTTLVTGKAMVVKGTAKNLLSPGQQIVVDGTGKMGFVNNADVEQAIAWKNGIFRLKASSIETVMRQIARWYDVDVRYEGGKVNQVFYGTIPRTVTVANVFRVLEETGGVHFKIEGKNVTVMP